MKEQVATILGNMAHEIKQCDSKDPVLGLEIKQATLQICQLFEPKPGEGRLLSWERIRMVFQEQDKKGQHDNMFRMEALCKAQRDLAREECQERVERILNEIESHKPESPFYPVVARWDKDCTIFKERKWYKALKKKELK